MLVVTTVSVALYIACVAEEHFTVPNSAKQVANGSPSFEYFSINSQQAAASLLQLLVGLDHSILKFSEELQKTNSASLELQKYEETLESIKNTNCSFEGIDSISNAEKDILLTIETCRVFAPEGRRSSLKKAITKSVSKIQTYDNHLRLSDYVCSSLRKTPSKKCLKSKRHALEGIKHVVSNSKMSRLGILDRKAFLHTKKNINLCVAASTEHLRLYLESMIEQILECKNNLN